MAAPKQVRLRVGVIGLGRLWEARHKPALTRMNDRFRVTAVYDQVARRAELEANVLGCASAPGLIQLIERPDVDVIYLLSPQWFGLHGLEHAVKSGKPVYCALPLAGEPDALKRIDAQLDSTPSLFMPEFARRFYPVTIRLRELLETNLGPPRFIVGQVRLAGFDRYDQPGPSTQIAPAPLLIDPGSYLLDWCRFVFKAEATAIHNSRGTLVGEPKSTSENDVETLTLEFPGGALAQISVARYHRNLWGDAAKSLPVPGLQIYAERGAAWIEMPDRIVWSDSKVSHDERLLLEPSIGERLNLHFHQAVCEEQALTPDWQDALAVARLVLRLK